MIRKIEALLELSMLAFVAGVYVAGEVIGVLLNADTKDKRDTVDNQL